MTFALLSFDLAVTLNQNLNANNNNANQNDVNAVLQSANNQETNTNSVNQIGITLLPRPPAPGKRSAEPSPLFHPCRNDDQRRLPEVTTTSRPSFPFIAAAASIYMHVVNFYQMAVSDHQGALPNCSTCSIIAEILQEFNLVLRTNNTNSQTGFCSAACL